MVRLELAIPGLQTQCPSHWAIQFKSYCWEGVEFIQLVYCIIIHLSFLDCDWLLIWEVQWFYWTPELLVPVEKFIMRMPMVRLELRWEVNHSWQMIIYNDERGKFKIRHGKLKLTTETSNSPRKKFNFPAENLNSPQQIQIDHRNFKFTMAKFKFATANSNSPQQIQIHHGKFKFTVANSNSLRQLQIYHGKFKFVAANSGWPGQVQIRHGKFKSIAANSPPQIQIHSANSNSPRQIQIHCGKSKFTTSNSNSRRQIQ